MAALNILEVCNHFTFLSIFAKEIFYLIKGEKPSIVIHRIWYLIQLIISKLTLKFLTTD